MGGVVDRDAVEQFAGDRFGAVEDGGERGGADEVRQAADDAAGAAVQVVVQAGEGAGLVVVEPQRGFEGGDQARPFGLGRGTGRC